MRFLCNQADEPGWVGEVQDVTSGQRVYVQCLAELVEYLEQWLMPVEIQGTNRGIK